MPKNPGWLTLPYRRLHAKPKEVKVVKVELKEGEVKPPLKKPCAHCHEKEGSRNGGLCWHCYFTPEIRAKYVGKSKFARCSNGLPSDHVAKVRLAAKPTYHLPGTKEKIIIMEERARLGQSLFHPLDALGGGLREHREDMSLMTLPTDR